MTMFAVIARVVGEPGDSGCGAFGILPLAVGNRILLDAAMIHRDLKAS